MSETLSSPPEAAPATAPELKPGPILNYTQVNDRVVVRDDPAFGWRVVLVSGIVFASYHVGDKHSERLACVRLRLDGFAQQLEIAAVFGYCRTTLHRWERSYLKEGLPGLGPYRPDGRPVSVPASVEGAVVKLHGQGDGMRRIAHRLGVSIGIVRGVYQRHGLQPHVVGEQQELPAEELVEHDDPQDQGAVVAQPGEEEAEDGEQPARDAADAEAWDGLLVPEYETAPGVPWAGVLLAVPVMRRHRVLEVFSELYGTLGILGMYGLQTVVCLMVYLSLWRIKRPEHVKGHSPWDLGRVLGLGRAPEVRTVRRKLAQLAGRGLAREAMVRLAKVRIEQEEDLLGFLYVDGHVRPYSGQLDVGKGYSMQRKMPVRATTDTWANDRHGDPLFVVTSELNEGLTQTLRPVLQQVREVVDDERRITVVFDRGGFSPQLFVELIEAGYDIITYRKGRTKPIPASRFSKRVFRIDGKKVTYRLNDQSDVRVGARRLRWSEGEDRPLRMRQVTRLNPDSGHQTMVLTTRKDLDAVEVLWWMFNRWRQENFFKYMLEEFAVDGLVEYGGEGVDPDLERPNPEHLALTKEIKATRARIKTLQGQRCELIGELSPAKEPEAPPGWERFSPERSEGNRLLAHVRDLRQHLQELEARRAEVPERISAGGLQRLKTERQQVATVFKVAAYNIETELFRMVAPHYARAEDEGRKLIAAALRSPADLEVADDELRVTLAPQSSPHRSRAIAALCASLNKEGAVAPGTGLRLVLDCAAQSPTDVSP
jgi:hypothetical protein